MTMQEYKRVQCPAILEPFWIGQGYGYKKAARKGRIQKEPLYRESSLINFCNELDLV